MFFFEGFPNTHHLIVHVLAPTGALEEGMCDVHVIMLRMTIKEFLMHSKESRRVLSKLASMQASR